MRIALLSALKQSSDGQCAAAQNFLGRSVLEHQFELAQLFGAKKVFCLAHQQSAATIAVQQLAEAREVDFYVIAGADAIKGMVAADHDLIVIEDGVLIDPSCLPQECVDARAILVTNSAIGEVAGMERIDAKRSWAGLLRCKGDLIEKLAELPPDGDVQSLLLRLALQSRAPMVDVGDLAMETGGLIRADAADDLAQREAFAFAAQIPATSAWGGASWIAARTAGAIGARILGKGALIGAIIAIVASLIGAILAWAEFSVAAFLTFGFGALALATNNIVSAIKAGGEYKINSINVLFDVILVFSIMMAMGIDRPIAVLCLAPITLFALHAARIISDRLGWKYLAELFSDRLYLSIAFAVAAGLGMAALGGAVVTIATLAVLVFHGSRAGIRQA